MFELFVKIWEILSPVVLDFVLGNPKASVIIFVIGILRILIKPLMLIIKKIIEFTKTDKDDLLYEKAKKNIFVRIIFFLIDWMTSVKLGGK